MNDNLFILIQCFHEVMIRRCVQCMWRQKLILISKYKNRRELRFGYIKTKTNSLKNQNKPDMVLNAPVKAFN